MNCEMKFILVFLKLSLLIVSFLQKRISTAGKGVGIINAKHNETKKNDNIFDIIYQMKA